MKTVEKLLLESNDSLRSAYQIAKRDGRDTNWKSFRNQLSDVLDRQHAITNEIRKRAAEENVEAAVASTNKRNPKRTHREKIKSKTIIPDCLVGDPKRDRNKVELPQTVKQQLQAAVCPNCGSRRVKPLTNTLLVCGRCDTSWTGKLFAV
jgi:hypothetical protein